MRLVWVTKESPRSPTFKKRGVEMTFSRRVFAYQVRGPRVNPWQGRQGRAKRRGGRGMHMDLQAFLKSRKC